jgi:putative transposase
MPRNARLIIPDIYHHAIQRGNNRQNIFGDEKDRLYYLKWARTLGQENSVSLIGYCLMTNHVHFLIFPRSNDGMIKFMKLVSQRYTQYFNRRYERTGKLWENRYKSHPVDPEIYYVVLRYIEMNPVRAGLVSDGAAYPWSSAPYHILGKEDPNILADPIPTAIFDYRDFFYQKENSQDHTDIRMALQQGRAWGKRNFMETLVNYLGESVMPRPRGRPKKKK